MCVEWVNDWEVATEPMTVYKVVRKDGKRFMSPTTPNSRADQGYGKGAGRTLEYKLGKKMSGDEPGFYCIANPFVLNEPDMVLLECVIPKGTKFRRGKAGVSGGNGQLFEMRTINPLVLKVAKVFRGKLSGKFNWPVSSTANFKYVWNYTSVSTTNVSYWIG